MTITHPFGNESETWQIGDATVENRIDHISIYGQLEITKDQQGLKSAIAMAELFNKIVTELQKSSLPEVISVDQPIKVNNPF